MSRWGAAARRRPGSAVVASVVLAASLAACSSDTGAGEEGDGVVVTLGSFPTETFDPSTAVSTGRRYFGGLYDPLVGATESGELATDRGLLESLEVDDTGTVYALTLRPGVTWHDGSALTADDVVFTFGHFTREEATCTICAQLKSTIDTVARVDDLTVEVTLIAPNLTFEHLLGPVEGDLLVLPEAYYERVGAEGFEAAPIGTGPWKFVSRRAGQDVTFEANNDYWDAARRPEFQRLTIELVPEASTRIARLQSGEADVVEISPEDIQSVQDDGFKVLGPTDSAFPRIGYQKSYDPDFLTNRLEFRKALAISVDWDAVVEALYPGGVGRRVASSLNCPICFGHDDSLQPYPYDPDQATTLLEASGYAGEPLTFYSYVPAGAPETPQLVEIVASYWHQLGVNVTIERTDFPAYAAKFLADPQDFDGPAVASVLPVTPRPSVVSNIRVAMAGRDFGGVIRTYWDEERANAWVEELTQIDDLEALDARLREINAITYEEYWGIPVAAVSLPFAVSERVGGWAPIGSQFSHLSFETLTRAE